MALAKLFSHEEMLDCVLGYKGEPLRDQYEVSMHSFLIREALKEARQTKNLTQEQLGETTALW